MATQLRALESHFLYLRGKHVKTTERYTQTFVLVGETRHVRKGSRILLNSLCILHVDAHVWVDSYGLPYKPKSTLKTRTNIAKQT